MLRTVLGYDTGRKKEVFTGKDRSGSERHGAGTLESTSWQPNFPNFLMNNNNTTWYYFTYSFCIIALNHLKNTFTEGVLFYTAGS